MISNRLKTIGDLINDDAVVYDVGADHGELERYISPRVKKIIAVENKKGPYEILCNATRDYENVTPVLADGLAKLNDEVDTIVIAGMGGLLINSILRNADSLSKVKHIIIDAHKDIEEVRRYVASVGFKIDKEILLKENSHYYIVISFVKGISDYSPIEYEFGRLKRNELFKEYFDEEMNRLEDIYSKSNNESVKGKIERMKSL